MKGDGVAIRINLPDEIDVLAQGREFIAEWVRNKNKGKWQLEVDLVPVSRLMMAYQWHRGALWGSLEREETKWYKNGDSNLEKIVISPQHVQEGGKRFQTGDSYIMDWLQDHPFCAASVLKKRAVNYLVWKPRERYVRRPYWMGGCDPPPINIQRLEQLRDRCDEYINQARAAVAEAPDWKTLVIRFCGEYSEGHNFLAAQLAIMSKLIPTLYYGNKEESKELYYELVYMRVSTRKFANANVTE